jgi:hypothetical protein
VYCRQLFGRGSKKGQKGAKKAKGDVEAEALKLFLSFCIFLLFLLPLPKSGSG